MKKNWLIALIFAFIFLGIAVGIMFIRNKIKISEQNLVENTNETLFEAVTDECEEEWQEIEEQAKLEVQSNVNEEKISPNCLITFKKFYNTCRHTLNQYISVPETLVNKTQIELQEEYKDWKIEDFSSTQIILYREYEGECGEHYILRENDGKIAIYKMNENNTEVLFEQTEIAIDYLTEADKIELKDGIHINGKERLNQLIEDFE
ncbi:MAG: hypothetical protein HFJ59_07080 [Clostridia bacterium]|nr:hypothetical protein [Clostridia bacterium]